MESVSCDAELLKEAERVPDLPRLSDLATLHAVNGDRLDVVHLVASSRYAVDVSDVPAAAGPAGDDLVTCRREIFDLPVAVDAFLVGASHLDHALRAVTCLDMRVVELTVVGEKLAGYLVVPAGAHFFVEPPHDGFLCCGHP
jgi:class 3 adenylate cyclase